jgi:hypothetical protein
MRASHTAVKSLLTVLATLPIAETDTGLCAFGLISHCYRTQHDIRFDNHFAKGHDRLDVNTSRMI